MEQWWLDHYTDIYKSHDGICRYHNRRRCAAFREAEYYLVHVEFPLKPPRFSNLTTPQPQ